MHKIRDAPSQVSHSVRTLDAEHTLLMRNFSIQRERRKHLDQRTATLREKLAEQERCTGGERNVDEILRLQDELRDIDKAKVSADWDLDEVAYLVKTGDILFRYYDILENGGTHVPSSSAPSSDPVDAPAAAVTSHHDTIVPTKKNSILKYFVNSSGSSPATQTTTAPEPTNQTTKQDGTSYEDRASLLERYLTCVYSSATTTYADGTGGKGGSCATSATNATPTPRGSHNIGGGSLSSIDQYAQCGPCAHCGSTHRTVIVHDGYMFCNHCNTLEYVLIDHEKPSYKDPPKEVTYFAYKRINHFNEWLNQIQGKETTEIPEDVYDRILLEIKKQKMSNMADLTHAKVKDILKKLRINKYYEHIPHIVNRLNGLPVPHLSPDLEERLRSMFCQIQVPFLKHSPSHRKNFLSYSYVLHKFMQLLEKDQYLPSFPLLKSREKLHQQDVIWRKICDELGWAFYKSI